MGFSNESAGGSYKYANFVKGIIITKIDGEKKSFTHLEGDLIDVDLEDAKFNDEPYRKIVLYIQHEDGITMLGFPMNSGYGQGFLKMCPNIDVNLPVKISGGTEPNPTNPKMAYTKIFIQQGGRYVKHYYSQQQNADKIPPVKEQTIGKGKSAKVVKDFTARDEFYERLLNGFKKEIEKVWPNGSKEAKAAKANTTAEPIDDLPF